MTEPVNAEEARSLAERWTVEEVARSPGEVLCVFTHGSINWMADEEHRELLRLLGAAELDDGTILAAASHCCQTLDEACRWLRTPFIGDNCVTIHARPSPELDVPACVAAGTGREIFLWVALLHAHALIAIENDAPAAVATAAGQVYIGDMAAIRSATLAEARTHLFACRPALERMVGLCDDIVARNARALA
jgi:hypothetical protein